MMTVSMALLRVENSGKVEPYSAPSTVAKQSVMVAITTIKNIMSLAAYASDRGTIEKCGSLEKCRISSPNFTMKKMLCAIVRFIVVLFRRIPSSCYYIAYYIINKTKGGGET
jgi:hypothetical protein